jgi:hypothetical protein
MGGVRLVRFHHPSPEQSQCDNGSFSARGAELMIMPSMDAGTDVCMRRRVKNITFRITFINTNGIMESCGLDYEQDQELKHGVLRALVEAVVERNRQADQRKDAARRVST